MHRFMPVALDSLQFWINRGKIDPARPITLKSLYEAGCIRSAKKSGIHLSDRGLSFLQSKNLSIKVQSASPAAVEAVEALGGSVECVYLSQREISAALRPEQFVIMPTQKQHPTDWKDLRHYLSAEHRGYLAPKEGETVESVVATVMRQARMQDKRKKNTRNSRK
ncbi:MAG: hypothetical protein SGCHY_001308 [Lobulomycetales sp.]